jgi:hypothetical protein
MHCGGSRYMKVVNKDGVSVMTTMVRQLRYMSITPMMKLLFLFKDEESAAADQL